jgi:transposase
VEDRKVLNGIYLRLRTGSPWADLPERYGPYTTRYNRFIRWRKLGVWDAIFDVVSTPKARHMTAAVSAICSTVLALGKPFSRIAPKVVRETLAAGGAKANVKPMPNRVNIPKFNKRLHSKRNLVERFFNKLWCCIGRRHSQRPAEPGGPVHIRRPVLLLVCGQQARSDP